MGKELDKHRVLCERYCTYYKPGKSEEQFCGGYIVVERIRKKNGHLSFDEKKISPAGPADSGLLVQNVCSLCDFRADGCDFFLDRQSTPCGGFQFLAQALSQGSISTEDLSGRPEHH